MLFVSCSKYFNGLGKEICNSSASAMELHLSGANPSISLCGEQSDEHTVHDGCPIFVGCSWWNYRTGLHFENSLWDNVPTQFKIPFGLNFTTSSYKKCLVGIIQSGAIVTLSNFSLDWICLTVTHVLQDILAVHTQQKWLKQNQGSTLSS